MAGLPPDAGLSVAGDTIGSPGSRMEPPETSSIRSGSGVMFLALLLFIIFVAAAVLSSRTFFDGPVVVGFNFFLVASLLLFIYLVHKSLDRSPQPPGIFVVSAYTIGPWTLVVGLAMLSLLVALQRTSPPVILGFVAIAILPFAMGTLMGSPRIKSWKLTGSAFVVGYVATFAAALSSIPFVIVDSAVIRDIHPIPAVAFSGLLSVFVGSLCALGSFLGAFIRTRIARTFATPVTEPHSNPPIPPKQ